MEPASTGVRAADNQTDSRTTDTEGSFQSSLSGPATGGQDLARRTGRRTTERIPPSQAVLARPLLVLLPIATFLIPALLLAFVRTPTYSAEARLIVGGFNVQAQAVPGFVEAARTLAETYSRLVSTPAIERPAAEESGLAPDLVTGGIRATAVPESSIIRVIGSADNARDAIRLADAAAKALVDYANGAGDNTTEAETLRSYQEASRELAAAQEVAQSAAANLAAQPAGSSQLQAARDAVATARAAVAAAELRQTAIGDRYAEKAEGSGSAVAVVSPATSSGSDWRATLQIAIAAPVLLGLVAGTALATIAVNRPAKRREHDA